MGIYLPGPKRTLLLDTEPLQRALKQLTPTTEGAPFDLRWSARRGTVWTDSSATIFARPGDPIGAVLDARGRYIATQATGSAKPILQTDGNRWWCDSDGTKQLAFALSSPLGNAVLMAAVRPAVLAGTQTIISNFSNNDTDGQSELQLLDTAVRYLYRRTGGNQAPSAGALTAGVDVVLDGTYSSAATQGVSAVNGIEGGASTPLAKVGTGTAVQLLARGASGTPFDGRVYAMAIVGMNPVAPGLGVLRRWAAHAAGRGL